MRKVKKKKNIINKIEDDISDKITEIKDESKKSKNNNSKKKGNDKVNKACNHLPTHNSLYTSFFFKCLYNLGYNS